MKLFPLVFACVAIVRCAQHVAAAPDASFKASDPFIWRDDAAKVYRLYSLSGSNDPDGPGVVMRTSADLKEWSRPTCVLRVPDELNCRSVWAPEMHPWKGAYYIFGTICTKLYETNCVSPMAEAGWAAFGDKLKKRLSTWVFKAENPEGPFRAHNQGPIPPADWATLDGTLFVEDGKPYMVFCHEWTQLRNGTVDAVEMTDDLCAPKGEPFTLFKGSDAWGENAADHLRTVYVTDGPFLYRSKTGELLMLWSSARNGYLQLVARSETGRLAGPWKKHDVIYSADGGHGMIFKTFDGHLALALHSPNTPGTEKRLRIHELEDLGTALRIGRQIGGDFTPPPANRWIAPAPVTVKVDLAHPAHKIPATLYGLFLEDISQSVDGGFYPELVWNRGFDFPSLRGIQGWEPDCRDGSMGRFTLQYRAPLHPDTPACLRIEAFASMAGMRNTGAMNEMSVKGGVPLELSLYARGRDGYKGGVLVRLEDEKTNLLAEARFDPAASGGDTPPDAAGWKQFEAVLTPKATCRTAHLSVFATAAGTLEFEQVSLMPKETFGGRANGLRKDIGELMKALRPATFRFPGGCMLEGDDFAAWWDWKRTVGPIVGRQPIWNIWGYYQTLGLGYYEYFLFCEDIGAEPVPVFSAAMTCQFRGPKFAPLASAGYFITNVLDGIEFARGGTETKWGALRAEMGHPAPFPLHCIGIGNENWGPAFWERYNVLQKAVKAKYPDIKMITDIDPKAYMDQALSDYSWQQVTPANADIADEHMYASPSWWLNHTDFYDQYPRTGVKVYVGEWATRQASDAYINSMYNAVAEAAFRMGFEKNADLVEMTAYAPLIRRAGVPGNRYSLIQLDGTDSCGAPAYYVDKLFALNRPSRLVPVSYEKREAIQPAGIDRPKWFYNPDSQEIKVVSFHATAGLDEAEGELVVKLANAALKEQAVTLDFGRTLPASSVRRLCLADKPDAKNFPSEPLRVVPKESSFAFAGGETFPLSLPPCSVTILRLQLRSENNEER
jgi:alpha-N-arabinofuranosidase